MKVFVVKENNGYLLESGINRKLDYIKDNQFNLIKISYLVSQDNPSLFTSGESDVVAIIEYEEV